MCLVCSLVAQADTTIVEPTIVEEIQKATGTVTEVVEGIEKISGNVWQALEELAKALKVPASHIYSVIITQQIVKAIVEIIVWFIIPLVLMLISFNYAVKKWKFFDKEIMEDSDGGSAWLGVGMIIIPAVFMIFGCDWTTIITGFINPEFGALTDITEMVQTLTQ